MLPASAGLQIQDNACLTEEEKFEINKRYDQIFETKKIDVGFLWNGCKYAMEEKARKVKGNITKLLKKLIKLMVAI